MTATLSTPTELVRFLGGSEAVSTILGGEPGAAAVRMWLHRGAVPERQLDRLMRLQEAQPRRRQDRWRYTGPTSRPGPRAAA